MLEVICFRITKIQKLENFNSRTAATKRSHLFVNKWPAAEPYSSGPQQTYRGVEVFIDDNVILHTAINK